MMIHRALRYINLMVNMDNPYVNSYLNYTGSKYKLLPQLIPLFDGRKPNFIDLFCGGAVVSYNVVDRYEKVWMNDKIKDLIGIHKNLIARGQDFTNDVKLIAPMKEDATGFQKLRDSYNTHPSAEGLFALILCCTNNMMRFAKKGNFNSTFGKRSFNLSTQKKIDNFLQHINNHKDKLYFTALDFELVIPNEWARTMLYCDIPYFSTEAGYNSTWNENDEKRLFSYLMRAADAGASVALSNVYDDECSENNALVVNLLLASGKFNMVKLTGDYKKVARDKSKKQLTEVLIRNYQ